MVAAPRAVLVEVGGPHLMLGEIFARGRGQLDRTGRRDVVGGDLVAEDRQDARIDDIGDRLRLLLHALEVRRVLHVGRAHVPAIGLARRGLDLAPVGVALEHIGVLLLEDRRGHELLDEGIDLLGGRPDVLEEDRLAVLAGAERFLGQVLGHGAGERVGHHQRRRRQIVGLHVRRDAAFEVAVARQHGGSHDAVVVDRLGNLFRQRPRIADAGGAAETDQVEADLVEVLLQSGVGKILRNHLAARRERGLHPRLCGQALGGGIAGEQARGDQHARVRGVGAGGDRGDHHVTMAEIEVAAFDRMARLIDGLLVVAGHRGGKAFGNRRQRDAAFRTLRPGQRGHHIAEIEHQGFGEHRIGRFRRPEQTLRLGVLVDQCHARRGAAGDLQIVDGFLVDREEAAGGAVFRRHVADGRLVRDREIVEAGTEELDELADHALLAQHLRHGEHEVGGGDAFLQRALQLEADHLRQQHRKRLPQHRGFRLDAADAPAEHGETVDHRGVRIGADQRVRIRDFERAGLLADGHLLLLGPDRLRQVFQIDLMADAGAGRHHGEVVEGALSPLQELVALLVLLVLFGHVLAEGGVVAEEIDDHRVIDDEVDRDQRVDLLGVATERLHRIAHRGEIHHCGHAGEVLHQHPRRTERDFMLELALLQPFRDGLDVFLLHRATVFIAQQVLQQHLHRVRQPGNPLETIFFSGRQAVIDIGLGADLEGLPAFEAVERTHVRQS